MENASIDDAKIRDVTIHLFIDKYSNSDLLMDSNGNSLFIILQQFQYRDQTCFSMH